MIWDAVVGLASKVIDRAFPDPIEKQKAQVALMSMVHDKEMAELKAETETQVKQIEVNAIEAASQDPFVRRARPCVIWAGVIGLLYQTVGQPTLAWIGSANGWPPPPPIDTSALTTLLFALLGVSGMRSYDKKTTAETEK